MPVSPFKGDLVLKYELIRCDTNVPQVIVEPTFPFLGALFPAPVVGENFETWCPFLELHLPVEHDTGRDNNEMRSPDALFTRKMSDQSNGLDCFPNICALVSTGNNGLVARTYPSPISSANIPFVWPSYRPTNQSSP